MVDEVNGRCEAEFSSSMNKYGAMNEFDVDNVLGFGKDAISGTKIAGGFTDHLKLMLKNHFSKGI